jgi:SAM-dependent methyltransferase
MKENPSAARFDRLAENFATSEVHRSSPTIQRLHALLDFTEPFSVCDVACGAGHLALSFQAVASRIMGVDPAPGMLRAFQELAAERGLEVETRCAVAEDIPLPSSSFDLVTSRLAPHHFRDVERALAEMARITRPGGCVAVIDLQGFEDPAVDDFNHRLEILHDPTHVRSYLPSRWRSIFEQSGLCALHVETDLSERPQGTTVARWCEIASSGAEAEAEIRKLLRQAPAELLSALSIRREGTEFVVPARTLLIVGKKPGAGESSSR